MHLHHDSPFGGGTAATPQPRTQNADLEAQKPPLQQTPRQRGVSAEAPPVPSTALPFTLPLRLSSISGPTYVTAQTLIQQVSHTLSDHIFTYSPPSFDLDVSLRQWAAMPSKNTFGFTPSLSPPMETRTGAASLALGYIFSADFDESKRHVPQSILASTASLVQMRPQLDTLVRLYGAANPVVAHVAAADYVANAAGGKGALTADYAGVLDVAADMGLACVASGDAREAQHMAMLATLIARLGGVPSIHMWDGVRLGRETSRVVDALSAERVGAVYRAVEREVDVGSTVSAAASEEEKGARVEKVLDALNEELGTQYGFFEYSGHSHAETVLVVFGSVEATMGAQVAASLAKQIATKVGVINVRLYRPFIEESFLAALPSTVRNVKVLGQVKDFTAVRDPAVSSKLFADVLAAICFDPSRQGVVVEDAKYAREEVWTPAKIATLLAPTSSAENLELVDLSDVKQFGFWALDDSPIATAGTTATPLALARFLSSTIPASYQNVTVQIGFDNMIQGGIVRTDVRCSKKSIEAPYPIQDADIIVVDDEKLLKEFDVLASVQKGGKMLVKLPGLKETIEKAKDEEKLAQLEKRLPEDVRKEIVDREIELFVLDPAAIIKDDKETAEEATLMQLAFLDLLQPEAPTEKLSDFTGFSPKSVEGLSNDLENALRHVEIPASWGTVEKTEEKQIKVNKLGRQITVNSFVPSDREEQEPPNLLRDWTSVAKGIAFKEAYGTVQSPRPDLSHLTYTVHVKTKKRLTPSAYDRNIFHIEFDLGNSGLQYNIGEALGIHPVNDPTDVDTFIKWYGLDPTSIVEVPARADAENGLESRTVFQALSQNIDIFGRPPKRFYEALSEYATDDAEKKTLLALGGPEGAVEFKRLAEVDTVTFADILLDYPSAHPPFAELARMVTPLKRREYSIASAQAADPSVVALLIVTVAWTARGKDRFGLATRYLDSLKIGAPVAVSVKPSVMKLPTDPGAPIIMAGLGTGLAPFRAFAQERALRRARGETRVGPAVLYLGSRRLREEYLYGEEWEAYLDAGVLVHVGRAFSRDQPYKIYIQDRMRQTLDNIRNWYLKEGGSFYLCGPTWPVPDVTEVLKEALMLEAKENSSSKRFDGMREIERLKEEGRYVLEVY
ncbi:hypothetical protein BDY21DRAFT_357856 [Lineolata rhizophorae]|uniref:assimilatory sulfite reductase (NADPH) n=1 Tax=Lineolata rhizophorae TaxID=578093 RepID=A0A6A6NNP2_9PEZI|nr:hypothetical protein BDY21DRAFT_357856 [Lineolata rhizophorae]